ncbi:MULTISPECIES: phosphopantetheine-binding protein [unclassified Gilliamella]|uniref:phosphopantetheine-binding protein n=1 Tax=unclassified Gilliamella TaxID=2685620 RepID=UPI00080E8276|nr:phosphopantetheine-binding protein [Gilliamella apicola]OCG21453.1 acyl carrier protein [Gilliamella apicola]OCG22581.1 acyl carrier protein [Gilliamella apicola]
MEKLHKEIKTLIIDVLNLESITPDDIDTQAPLFGDGLGLDSIDALELGLAIKNKYGIVLAEESEATKKAFYSIQSLANFISSQQK